jgi:hypothetical protein
MNRRSIIPWSIWIGAFALYVALVTVLVARSDLAARFQALFTLWPSLLLAPPAFMCGRARVKWFWALALLLALQFESAAVSSIVTGDWKLSVSDPDATTFVAFVAIYGILAAILNAIPVILVVLLGRWSARSPKAEH